MPQEQSSAAPVVLIVENDVLVHRSQADTRIILTSGAARTPGDVKKYASFLPKPYGEKDVERLVRSVLPSS